MTKYRGYYIDGFTIKSKKEIDDFLRDRVIKHFIEITESSVNKTSPEIVQYICELSEKMVKYHGFTYLELEELEVKTLQNMA